MESHRASFESQSRLFPIEQPTRVAVHIGVAALDERSVKSNARKTIHFRAVDDDPVILVK